MAKDGAHDQRSLAWVGREMVRILNQAEPGTVRDLFQLIHDRGGKLGDLMNALADCDVTTIAKPPKKELSEDEKERRRENLKKAREAKKAKAVAA